MSTDITSKNIARKFAIGTANLVATGLIATGLVAAGLVATASSAAAREGIMPFDTLVCRDQGIIAGFADRMKETTPDQFWDYVGSLVQDGRCDRIVQGEPVAFTERPDGGSCVSLRANLPCYWSVAKASSLTATAVAARTPPTTTGQGAAPETTGSVAPRASTGETVTIKRTTTTIIRPGERPVTTTETTRTGR
jgi:hypothetical protein